MHECYSACTTLFLAGRERTLGNNAILGFHAPFPIEPSGDPATAAREYEAELRQAGIPANFARRVVTTPHDAIWNPTIDELFAAGVITHIETTPERYIEMLDEASSRTPSRGD